MPAAVLFVGKELPVKTRIVNPELLYHFIVPVPVAVKLGTGFPWHTVLFVAVGATGIGLMVRIAVSGRLGHPFWVWVM